MPAAYCGVVGYKPTARRVPIEGILPLAPSLDSVGPLARSVACCAVLDAIMAGEEPRELRAADVSRLHLAVPTTLVLDDMDTTVAADFERACSRLSAMGARITPRLTSWERIWRGRLNWSRYDCGTPSIHRCRV